MIALYLILLMTNTTKSDELKKTTTKFPQTFYASLIEIPYHVLIVYDNLYCSGGLIRSRMVVTAASCFKQTKGNVIIVKVGAQTTTDVGQVIEVIEVKKHEYFGRHSDIDNDIAILMLKEHVAFRTYVKKIVIMERIPVQVGTTLNVSGWGSVNLDPKYMNKLLWSEMVIVSDKECKKHYRRFKTAGNFCVRYQLNQLLSDNGGPAVYHDKLVGVISYGADNSIEPYMALVTNVSYFYRWIDLNVERFLRKYCIPPPDYEYYYTDTSETESEE